MLIRAVATSVERQGTGLGATGLGMMLAVLRETKIEYDMDCGVWARIHRENVPSQRLFRRAGFECLGSAESGELEHWVRPA